MRPIEELRVNRRRREVLRRQRHDVRNAASITELLRSEALQSETRVPDVGGAGGIGHSRTAGYIGHVSGNSGGAATSVRILGELSRDGTIVETAEITQLFGRCSTESAGPYFTRDPAQHPLSVRPISFLVS